MKTLLFLTIIFSLQSCDRTSNSQKSNISQDGEVENMLTNFYEVYITENEKLDVDEEKINELKNKYCTKQFLLKLDSRKDMTDPFINGQDYSTDWLHTIKVKRQKEQSKNIYALCFEVSNMTKSHCVNVQVIKKGNNWLINDVYW